MPFRIRDIERHVSEDGKTHNVRARIFHIDADTGDETDLGEHTFSDQPVNKPMVALKETWKPEIKKVGKARLKEKEFDPSELEDFEVEE